MLLKHMVTIKNSEFSRKINFTPIDSGLKNTVVWFKNITIYKFTYLAFNFLTCLFKVKFFKLNFASFVFF